MPHSVNYVRSAVLCHHQRSSHWLSLVTLVLSRLDYGNTVLVGLPTHLATTPTVSREAAARLIYHMRSADHITDALVTLHWLRIPQQIEYKVAMMTYKVLHGTAPRYLGPLTLVSDLPGRRTLRSATSRLLVPPVRLSAVGSRAFTVAGPPSGICFRRRLHQLSHGRHSTSVSRLTCS